MLLKEESSCGGLFDSGTVGVCPSVRTYVRTDILLLERGAMLGYLILLPLVLMLKVLNDGAYMSYVLPRGMRHVHMMHVTCLISF